MTRPRSATERTVDALSTRVLRLPPRRGGYSVTANIPVRAHDGVVLLTDHFAPDGPAVGTVVMRTPYGRSGLVPQLLTGLFAAREYHVVVQSCRGTFGSGGQFAPGGSAIEDGATTIAWLREQPWFEGRLALVGGSALSHTMWGMLVEPVPELVAVAAFASFDDSYTVTQGNGAFRLQDILTVCDSMAGQERRGVVAMMAQALRSDGGLGTALASLPVADAADRFVGPGWPWYRDSASRLDPADPYWRTLDASAALDRLDVPVRLISGWQDVFLRETLGQYRRLRDRGVEVALTVGPWTHLEMATGGMSRVLGEVFDWVDRQVRDARTTPTGDPVSFYVTGAGEWRYASEWPPSTGEHRLYLGSGRSMTSDVRATGTPSVDFRYDPRDPTPTVGGRFLSRRAGYQEDSGLARRSDTASFVTAPLRQPLEVIGVPRVILAHQCDKPEFDLWVRVSEVRPDGRSHNVTEAFRGSPRAAANGRVELALDPCAHRFAAGSRIGLLVGGGSFPAYARNLGTPGNRCEGIQLAPSRHVLTLAAGASSLSLPSEPPRT
jgi:putative CocE/NonD family hydrolase